MPNSFHVVVVEDDEMLLELLKATFNTGYRVAAFVDAESAWEYLLEYNVDIVISDIEMPGMGGIALLQRTKMTFPRTKCIIISGSTHKEKMAIDSGADAFLSKPFLLEDFSELVDRVLMDGK